jgi:hypothetical protein
MFNFERIYHTAIFIFVQSMCLRVLKKIINMRYLFTYLQTMFDFINGMLTSEVYEEKIIGHVLEDHEHSYRINKTKDYYLAYIHYISGHFYPYTLSNRQTRSAKLE